MDYFIDLGAGFFLYEDEESRLSAVCDATASEPNHHFGPAAWGRLDGPVSGLTILEAQAVAQGGWDQTGPEEWKWFSVNLEEFDEAPASWPRRIVLMDSSKVSLLDSLAGRVVSSEAELVELVRGITCGQPPCVLTTLSAAKRLAVAKSLYPHAFRE
jgi:hypothetical protein